MFSATLKRLTVYSLHSRRRCRYFLASSAPPGERAATEPERGQHRAAPDDDEQQGRVGDTQPRKVDVATKDRQRQAIAAEQREETHRLNQQ